MQIKAETQLLADVNKALRVSLQVGSKAEGNLQNLQAREDLLHALLENEQMRLVVWLYPLDHERRHLFASQSGKTSQEVGIRTLLLMEYEAYLCSYLDLSLQPLGWSILA